MTRWSRPAHLEVATVPLDAHEKAALRADDRCRNYPAAEFITRLERDHLRAYAWRRKRLSRDEQRKDFPDA